MRDARRDGSPYPKADLTLRGLARLLDLTLAFAVANVAREAGPPLAALYLLFADGLMQGESVLRNAPFALVGLFYGLTLVGWLLFFVVGLPIVAFEAYMVWSDRLGIRIGDIFADTQVVDAKVLAKDVVTAGGLRAASTTPSAPSAGA